MKPPFFAQAGFLIAWLSASTAICWLVFLW